MHAAHAFQGQDASCEADLARVLDDRTLASHGTLRLDDELVSVCGYTDTVAQFESLQRLAEGQGLNLTAAIDRYGFQDEFVHFVNDLREAYPEDFAGAEFVPGGTSWIAFSDEVPSEVEVPAREIEFIEGKGFSEADLTESLTTSFEAVSKRPELGTVFGVFDAAVGEVLIEAVPAEGFSIGQASAALDSVTTARMADAAVHVSAVIDPNLSGETEQLQHMRGGGYLQLAGWLCTAAFGVHGGTLDGILTAEHCALNTDLTERTIGLYNDYPGALQDTVISLVDTNDVAQSADAAWYGSADGEGVATFFNDFGSVTAATDTQVPVVGQWLQFFGHSTGRSESQVTHTFACMQYPYYGTYCGLTAMDGHNTAGGDSGGPWFDGTEAYGVHSGTATNSIGQEFMLFSRIDIALADLDLTLLT